MYVSSYYQNGGRNDPNAKLLHEPKSWLKAKTVWFPITSRVSAYNVVLITRWSRKL